MKILLFTLTIITCNVILAQKQDITELNKILTNEYEFEWTKKGIEINFLKNGETFRKEYFKSADIDWEKLYFNEEDNSIVVTCQANFSDCIDRKIIRTKSRRSVSKTAWKVSSPEKATRAIEILKHFSAF